MSALYAVRLANGEWWSWFYGPYVWEVPSVAEGVLKKAQNDPDRGNPDHLRNARIVPVKLVEAPDA